MKERIFFEIFRNILMFEMRSSKLINYLAHLLCVVVVVVGRMFGDVWSDQGVAILYLNVGYFEDTFGGNNWVDSLLSWGPRRFSRP